MTWVSGRVLTDAIIAALAAAPCDVGDGEKPTGAGWQGVPDQSQFAPYLVLHPVSGGTTDGTLAASDDDAASLYQLTAVGATREQAEWAADEGRDVMLGVAITVSGRSVAQVRVDMLGGARRDDTVQPSVWMAVDRYRVVSTP